MAAPLIHIYFDAAFILEAAYFPSNSASVPFEKTKALELSASVPLIPYFWRFLVAYWYRAVFCGSTQRGKKYLLLVFIYTFADTIAAICYRQMTVFVVFSDADSL